MALALAVAIFAVFAANVVLSSFGGTPFLGDIGEMLTLFAASVAFVAAILKREAASKNRSG